MLKDLTSQTRFSDFVFGTGFDDLPAETTERARDLILDLVGVGIAARDIPFWGFDKACIDGTAQEVIDALWMQIAFAVA